MFRDSWAGLITITWERISKRIQKDFGLDYVSPPEDIRPSYESRQRDFGGWIEGNRLVLSNECLRGKIPHIGVLARGYMRKALEKERFEETALEDFAYGFGALWLPSKSLKYWYSRWKYYAGTKGDESTGFYDPSAAFHLFQSFSGAQYFNKLLNEYIMMKRSGLKLDETDYVLHMLERVRRFSVQLTRTDFSLIRRLLLAPETKRIELAAETGKTVSWVSRRLATLQEHGVLRRTVEVFHPGLGMKEFILLMNSYDESSIADYIIDFPFLYSANRIIAGEHDIVAHLLVPQNPRNFHIINLYLRILSDYDIETRFIPVNLKCLNRCFDHYSAESNTWELPWELFGPHLRRIYNENLSVLMTPNMQKCDALPMTLRHSDFRLIGEYATGIPLREIRCHLGVKYKRLVTRLTELKSHGLLRDSYDLHHCGLNESLFVHIPEPSYADAVISWGQRLPYTQSLIGGDNDGMLFLRLPDGGLQGMALVLQSLFPNMKPMLLDSHSIIGPWYVSEDAWTEKVITLWDEESQIWHNSEDEVNEWLSALP